MARRVLSLYGRMARQQLPVALCRTKKELGGAMVLKARDMNYAVYPVGQHPALTSGNVAKIRPTGT